MILMNDPNGYSMLPGQMEENVIIFNHVSSRLLIRDNSDCYNALIFLFRWSPGGKLCEFLGMALKSSQIFRTYVRKGTCFEFVEFYCERR